MKTLIALMLLLASCMPNPVVPYQPPAKDQPHATLQVATQKRGWFSREAKTIITTINGKRINPNDEAWKLEPYILFEIPVGDTFVRTTSGGYIRFTARVGATYTLDILEEPTTFTLSIHDQQGRKIAARTFRNPVYADYQKHPLENALMDAIAMGNKAEVARLLRSGADANWHAPGGEPPLVLATVEENPEIIRLLVKHGAHVDGFTGARALSLAVQQGHTSIARYLLEQGADPNLSDCLLDAVRQGSVEQVRLLLQYHAYTGLYDAQGKTLLDIAKANRHTEIIRLLEQHSPGL